MLTLQREFRKIHEDSHYIYPTRQGSIATSLIFDVRFNSQTITLDVSIFNTRSPKESLQLIADINRHFMDRVILADDYMIKFDQYTPITTQNRIDMKKDGIEHIELTIDAKLYQSNIKDGPDNIQISRV